MTGYEDDNVWPSTELPQQAVRVGNAADECFPPLRGAPPPTASAVISPIDGSLPLVHAGPSMRVRESGNDHFTSDAEDANPMDYTKVSTIQSGRKITWADARDPDTFRDPSRDGKKVEILPSGQAILVNDIAARKVAPGGHRYDDEPERQQILAGAPNLRLIRAQGGVDYNAPRLGRTDDHERDVLAGAQRVPDERETYLQSMRLREMYGAQLEGPEAEARATQIMPIFERAGFSKLPLDVRNPRGGIYMPPTIDLGETTYLGGPAERPLEPEKEVIRRAVLEGIRDGGAVDRAYEGMGAHSGVHAHEHTSARIVQDTRDAEARAQVGDRRQVDARSAGASPAAASSSRIAQDTRDAQVRAQAGDRPQVDVRAAGIPVSSAAAAAQRPPAVVDRIPVREEAPLAAQAGGIMPTYVSASSLADAQRVMATVAQEAARTMGEQRVAPAAARPGVPHGADDVRQIAESIHEPSSSTAGLRAVPIEAAAAPERYDLPKVERMPERGYYTRDVDGSLIPYYVKAWAELTGSTTSAFRVGGAPERPARPDAVEDVFVAAGAGRAGGGASESARFTGMQMTPVSSASGIVATPISTHGAPSWMGESAAATSRKDVVDDRGMQRAQGMMRTPVSAAMRPGSLVSAAGMPLSARVPEGPRRESVRDEMTPYIVDAGTGALNTHYRDAWRESSHAAPANPKPSAFGEGSNVMGERPNLRMATAAIAPAWMRGDGGGGTYGAYGATGVAAAAAAAANAFSREMPAARGMTFY